MCKEIHPIDPTCEAVKVSPTSDWLQPFSTICCINDVLSGLTFSEHTLHEIHEIGAGFHRFVLFFFTWCFSEGQL